MNMHGCHQARVVHLNAGHTGSHNNPAPLPMRCFVVWSKRDGRFNQACTFICFSDREPESIAIGRPGADIPEFGKILRGIEEFGAFCPQEIHGLPDHPVFRIIPLGKTQEDVRVQKPGSTWHHACSP